MDTIFPKDFTLKAKLVLAENPTLPYRQVASILGFPDYTHELQVKIASIACRFDLKRGPHRGHSEETKRRISASKLGVPRSKQSIENSANSKRGAKLNISEEERQRRINAATGENNHNWIPPEVKAGKERDRLMQFGRLLKYGVSRAEYLDKRANGFVWCSSGKHFVKLEEIRIRKSGAKRQQWICPTCAHRVHLKRRFGVSREWYEKTISLQNNKCAICGSEQPGNKKLHFMVDHCHRTGKVRGLLCGQCNYAIERLESQSNWADKATRYLSEHKTPALM